MTQIKLTEVIVTENGLDYLKETQEQYIFEETLIGYDGTNRYTVILKEGRLPYILPYMDMIKREDIITDYLLTAERHHGSSMGFVAVTLSIPKLTSAYMLEELEAQGVL